MSREDMEDIVKKEIEKYVEKRWSVQAYIEYIDALPKEQET